MNGKEIAKKVRLFIKEMGFKRGDFSVTSDYNSVRIQPKEQVKLKELVKIEEYSEQFEKIDRCEVSGEILSGGNTYVSVCDHNGRTANWSNILSYGNSMSAKDFSGCWYEQEINEMQEIAEAKFEAEYQKKKEEEANAKFCEEATEYYESKEQDFKKDLKEGIERENQEDSKDFTHESYINFYVKYAPNVFLARCYKKYEKGEIVNMENQRSRGNGDV